EMKGLLLASQKEGQENIKRARHNAQCHDPDRLMEYENKAMLALIHGTDALLGLVQDETGG
ncbi:hypothetical protein LCGC14_2465990, partial [marine sediment metagenome]